MQSLMKHGHKVFGEELMGTAFSRNFMAASSDMSVALVRGVMLVHVTL